MNRKNIAACCAGLGVVLCVAFLVARHRWFLDRAGSRGIASGEGAVTTAVLPFPDTNAAAAGKAPSANLGVHPSEYPARVRAIVGDDRFVHLLAAGLTEEEYDFDRLPPELVSAAPMRMDSYILRAYKFLNKDPAANPAEFGHDMLSSRSPMVRTTGAVWMLEKERGLNSTVLNRLIRDETSLVPLTVLGWMRDAGLTQQALELERLWQSSSANWDRAIEFVREESLTGVAGRAALHVLERSGLPEEEKTELLRSIASAQDATYDVRWEAVMRLLPRLEPADFQYMAANLLDLPGAGASGVATQVRQRNARLTDFHTAMMLVNERVAGPSVAMQQALVLTPDDADLFFAQKSPLMLENVALWVESAVDRAAIAVQTGFASALEKHLAAYPENILPADQALTLRRIRSRTDALRRMERE